VKPLQKNFFGQTGRPKAGRSFLLSERAEKARRRMWRELYHIGKILKTNRRRTLRGLPLHIYFGMIHNALLLSSARTTGVGAPR